MKVADLMSSPAETCPVSSDAGQAARLMVEHGCGCLPVIDARGHLAGVVTDRDICIAISTRHRNAWQIPIREMMTRQVFSCGPHDDVSTALTLMKDHRVRRLPVIDEQGHLAGALSIDDVVRHSGRGRGKVAPEMLVAALRLGGTPRPAA